MGYAALQERQYTRHYPAVNFPLEALGGGGYELLEKRREILSLTSYEPRVIGCRHTFINYCGSDFFSSRNYRTCGIQEDIGMSPISEKLTVILLQYKRLFVDISIPFWESLANRLVPS